MFEQLMNLAAQKQLLVVSDFDGTLAEFSTDPANVPINQTAVAALQRLASLEGTEVVVLSGRDHESLSTVSGMRAPITLVGSHGAQGPDGQPTITLPPDDLARLDALTAAFEQLSTEFPGMRVERKPFHVVVHTRAIPAQEAEVFARAKELGKDFILTQGKCVVEFSPLEVTKGTWIAANRAGRPVLFLGDDVTDEHGFAALDQKSGGDVGVKVGEGESAAMLRVADVAAVGALLDEFASLRSALV